MPRPAKPLEAEELTEPRKAIADLIVKLCKDVTDGNVTDKQKTYEAIADLYTAIAI